MDEIRIESARTLLLVTVIATIFTTTGIVTYILMDKDEPEEVFGCGVVDDVIRPMVDTNRVALSEELTLGKELFEGNCTACHSVHQVKVGPALKDIKKQRDIKWIVRFVRNSQKVILKDKDPYAMALYRQYNQTEMTSFPSMKESEVKAIVAYISDSGF